MCERTKWHGGWQGDQQGDRGPVGPGSWVWWVQRSGGSGVRWVRAGGLKVGAQRAPRLLVPLYFFTSTIWIYTIITRSWLSHQKHLLETSGILVLAREDDEKGEAVDEEAPAVELHHGHSGHMKLIGTWKCFWYWLFQDWVLVQEHERRNVLLSHFTMFTLAKMVGLVEGSIGGIARHGLGVSQLWFRKAFHGGGDHHPDRGHFEFMISFQHN